ncbi:MAG: tyrosine-type recombinase/integrase [Holosporales bacterium]|jgi:integrase/recombinase XerC|nr:tyrosine-type recombinase/integrase [Holosporales bacterium]
MENDIVKTWKQYMLFSLGYSKNTVNSYTFDVILLQNFLKDYSSSEINLTNVTKQSIRAWILYRYQMQSNSPRSVARGLSAIKTLHKFMLENKIIESSEILNMRPPKISKTLPRPLDVEKLNSVIESVDTLKKSDWIIKRDKAFLVLIYSVGLRISEALGLKTTEILDNKSGFLNITGKGGKIRMVPLISFVKSIMLEYLDIRPHQSEYLFTNRFGKQLHETSIQKLLVKSRRQLGLSEKITPHALRHTCATHIMENSGDLRGIQELLGHTSINSTEIYADITRKYITDIYEKCHPLAKPINKPKIKL